MPSIQRKRTRQDPSEVETEIEAQAKEGDYEDFVVSPTAKRLKSTTVLTPEPMRAAKVKQLQEQEEHRVGERHRQRSLNLSEQKGLLQSQVAQSESLSTIGHLPTAPFNDDDTRNDDSDPSPPFPPSQRSKASTDSKMAKPKNAPPTDDDNGSNAVTLDALVPNGEEELVQTADDDQPVGLLTYSKQQRPGRRRCLSISFVLVIAFFVLAAVCWTALLLLDYTECQLLFQSCQQQVAEIQLLVNRQASDEFYLSELEKQLLYWKKEAKKHHSYAKGYQQQCQEQVEVWMETKLQ
jgi:hypothetical protein